MSRELELIDRAFEQAVESWIRGSITKAEKLLAVAWALAEQVKSAR